GNAKGLAESRDILFLGIFAGDLDKTARRELALQFTVHAPYVAHVVDTLKALQLFLIDFLVAGRVMFGNRLANIVGQLPRIGIGGLLGGFLICLGLGLFLAVGSGGDCLRSGLCGFLLCFTFGRWFLITARCLCLRFR